MKCGASLSDPSVDRIGEKSADPTFDRRLHSIHQSRALPSSSLATSTGERWARRNDASMNRSTSLALSPSLSLFNSAACVHVNRFTDTPSTLALAVTNAKLARITGKKLLNVTQICTNVLLQTEKKKFNEIELARKIHLVFFPLRSPLFLLLKPLLRIRRVESRI